MRHVVFALFLIFGLPLRAEVTPGEILFAEMNCAACHVTPQAQARLASRPAPKLGVDGVKLTPQWIGEFLADPQKTKPNTLMPDMLHSLPADQKAANIQALTHFLISAQGGAPTSQVGASSAKMDMGERLYHDYGCVQCHAPTRLPAAKKSEASAVEELAKLQADAVPLSGPAIAKKYTVAELAKFLADPLKTRPGGRMPSMNLAPAEAEAIAMWLLREQIPAGQPVAQPGVQVEYYEQDFPELPNFDRVKPTSTEFAETFSLKYAKRKNSFGLRFRGNLTVPQTGRYRLSVSSDDGSRLLIDGKRVADNGGIHPDQERSGEVELTAGVHRIEVQYFDGGGNTSLTVRWEGPGLKRQEIPASALSHEGQPMKPVGDAPFVVDRAQADRGHLLFHLLQCASCHGDPAPPVLDSASLPPVAKPLAAMRPRQPIGCLAPTPKPNAAKFSINDRQRTVLIAFLQNQDMLAVPMTPEEQIRRTTTTLNCYACHQRERRGGIEGLRRDYLASSGDVDLGEEGKVPPVLNGVGGKLREDWLREVITKGTKVRPYLATRMPGFGEANAGQLPALLAKVDLAPNAVADPETQGEAAAAHAKWGRKLIGTTGVSCVACHNFAGNKSLGVPAMDLAVTGQRLRFDWFRRYLLDPQTLRPGTRMPSFWPGGVAVNQDVLKGNTEEQIRALWLYFARQNFTDLPDGLVKGKEELVAQTEAVIYRNFIEGGGPRAIGVGYPEKANLSFDANSLVISQIWQGPFIDAAKHRTGRGEGFQKPLGRNVQKLPAGPAFAVLNSESDPWPAAETTVAGAPFKGYRLDEKQRPIFRYQIAGFAVEDYPVAVPGESDAFFRRSLTVRGTAPGQGQLYFRAAVGKIVRTGEMFFVDDRLTLKFPGATAILRPSGDKQELLVPIPLPNGAGQLVEELVW